MNSFLFRFLHAGWPWGWLTLAVFVLAVALLGEGK